MQSVGIESLDGVATVLASAVLEDNESLRAQVERLTQELDKCRECASHFKWTIKRQRQQPQQLRKPQ